MGKAHNKLAAEKFVGLRESHVTERNSKMTGQNMRRLGASLVPRVHVTRTRVALIDVGSTTK